MNTPSTLLIRAEGLDTMFIVSGISCKSAVRMLQGLAPSDNAHTTFYNIFGALCAAEVSSIEVVEEVIPGVDYLLRVDSEKIMIRETNGVYHLLPSWKNNVAPLAAIYPMGQGLVGPTWTAGDATRKSLQALEEFVIAHEGLGAVFSFSLLSQIKAARRTRTGK